ncbi:MAG: helix-turn-helix domain-containing protein [Solirubrobacterales bacterium]
MADAARLQAGLGEAIKRLRHREVLSQEDLAFRAGLHPTFISEIENGHKDLRLSSLCKVADGLGVSVLELIGLAERSDLR